MNKDYEQQEFAYWVMETLDYAKCSNCGTYTYTQYDGVCPEPALTKFCSNCGKRMLKLKLKSKPKED